LISACDNSGIAQAEEFVYKSISESAGASCYQYCLVGKFHVYFVLKYNRTKAARKDGLLFAINNPLFVKFKSNKDQELNPTSTREVAF